MTQPFLADDAAAALAYRMDALESGSDAVRGGPLKDEPMWLVQTVKAILAQSQSNGGNLSAILSKLAQPAVVDPAAVAAALTVEQLSAIGAAMGAEVARRLAG